MHLVVNIGGIPHLAKNERDVGHPAFVREPFLGASEVKAIAHLSIDLARIVVVKSSEGEAVVQ